MNVLKLWGLASAIQIFFSVGCPLGVCIWASFVFVQSIDDFHWINLLQFTFLQAALSALLVTPLALGIARIFARQGKFPGRFVLLVHIELMFFVPAIVLVMSLICLLGGQGYINQFLTFIGLPVVKIYGTGGIILTNSLINFPLCFLLFLDKFEQIPVASWRLSQSLSLKPLKIWEILEWPAVKSEFFYAIWVVFLLCCRNGTIILLLGSSPEQMTLEVGIYHALHMDFNPGKAGFMALIYVSFGIFFFAFMSFFKPSRPVSTLLDFAKQMRQSPKTRRKDLVVIGLCVVICVVCPLGVLLFEGIGSLGQVLVLKEFWFSFLTSFLCGAVLSVLTQILALGILIASEEYRIKRETIWVGQILKFMGFLKLMVPTSCIGVGFSIIKNQGIVIPIPVIFGILNVMMTLPFAINRLQSSVQSFRFHAIRIRHSLSGMTPGRYLRWVVWPALKPAVFSSWGACGAMMAGDMGCILFLPQGSFQSLSFFIYEAFNQGQLQKALGASLILLALCSSFVVRGQRWAARSK